MNDTYKTLLHPSEESLYKDRGSKFYGYAFPVTDEEQINAILKQLKEKHHKARHWCYAWQLGLEKTHYRVNDDGEPSNSAGQPIYGQIQSKELTNVLVVVVRYFGGTKLGVGGLVTAYKTAAQWALEGADIVVKTIDKSFQLTFEYKDMNKVQRIIKKYGIPIKHQKLELDCQYQIDIRKRDVDLIITPFKDLRCVKITELE